MAVDLSKLVDLERLKEEQGIEHGMIAKVESTSTASKAYAIGDRFYFKGKLCICTAPIASGGTITLNTNCKLDVLGDDVSELKTALSQNISNVTNIISTEKTKSGTYFSVYSKVKNASVDSSTQNLSVEHLTKNLLKTPYLFPDAYTTNGVTFTPLNDGTVKAQGTATADVSYRLTPETPSTSRNPLKAGTYTLSGTPSGGSSSSYRMMLVGIGQGSLYEYGDGLTFTIDNDGSYYAKILIKNGTTVDLIFKPQIEIGTVKSNYVPYKSETITLSNGHADVSMYDGVNTFLASSEFAVSYSVPETVNLSYYGAAGDGVTDDTVAIQQAFTESAGKTLIIPEGTYLFSKTLFIKSGTKIIGSGADSIFKLADTFTLTPYEWRDGVRYPMIKIESTEIGCVLENFTLKGQTTTFHDANCEGISVFGSNHVLDNLIVEDINCFPADFSGRVNNGVGYGIRVAGKTVSVRNCTVKNCGYECIGFEDADCCEVVNCYAGYACQTGIQVHRNCHHIQVKGNTIECYSQYSSSYRPGITLHAVTDYPMADIVISENFSASSLVIANGDAENDIKIINNNIKANILINDFNETDRYREKWIISGNYIGGLIQAYCNGLIITNNMINSSISTSHMMIRAKSNNYLINNNLAIGSYSDVEVNGEVIST